MFLRHTAPCLAAELAVLLLKYGFEPKSHGTFVDESQMELLSAFDFSNSMRVVVSDRGGGVPNAARWLGLFWLPCLLHVMDTFVKWALGLVNQSSSASQPSKTYKQIRDIYYGKVNLPQKIRTTGKVRK